MNFAFEEKYKPTSLDEVVFPSEQAKLMIDRYVSRNSLKPLLLYGISSAQGAPGTGKTTIAHLLPYAIDASFSESVRKVYEG